MFWQIQEKVTMYNSKTAEITKQVNFHSHFFFLMANISLGKFTAGYKV